MHLHQLFVIVMCCASRVRQCRLLSADTVGAYNGFIRLFGAVTRGVVPESDGEHDLVNNILGGVTCEVVNGAYEHAHEHVVPSIP